MRAMLHRRRRALWILSGLISAVIVAAGAANLWIVLSARGESTRDVASLPHAQAAIVLGAMVNPDGHMSGMLADRVSRAVELYRAGKVDRILVSGDHGRWSYDEPDTMRRALLHAGVPARAIFTDHAGFDTWASVVRARRVFGVSSAIIVTQGFHMARALYLADAAGLRARGLTADLHSYGRQQTRSSLRELLARTKAVATTTFDSRVLLGPLHPITGDGRATWGPAPPRGTPPTGAPGPG